MASRTLAIDAADDMDKVDPTSAGVSVKDVQVVYDDTNNSGNILTALENAKQVILKDIE